MADMRWSNEQLKVIEHKEGNLLVSASAGSGKTAVLTERVYRILKDKAPLNSVLILTFTNYAAQEMRDRIRQKLVDNGFDDIAANVDAVNFQTYDAFALGLVKKYHRLLNLPNDVKIVDKSLVELQKKKLLRFIMDEKYQGKDKGLCELVYKYCSKNDDKIIELILDIYDKAQLMSDSDEYINSFIENYYSEESIKEKVDGIFTEFNKNIKEYESIVKTFSDGDYADKVLEYLSHFKGDYQSIKNAYNDIELKYPRRSAKVELTSEEINLNKLINKYVSDSKMYFDYDNVEQIYQRVAKLTPYVKTLISIVKELSIKLDEYKHKYNVYTFQDIFKLAMKVVSIKEAQDKLRKQFKYIMIDEYQDTSDLQEQFISLIANNNVFAVGDIKQSIYRFRNANCDLFQSKFDAYQLGKGGKLITLANNYRSRKEVIDDNNLFFKGVMNIMNTGLNYERDHMMEFGNTSYEEYKEGSQNYHTETINFVKPSKEENISVDEYEARLIAFDIVKRYNAHTKVKDGSKLRDIQFSDFAILIYAKTNFGIYQKVFNEYGIPLYASYTQKIRNNNLTLTLKNIIKLISYYRQDIFDKRFLHSYVSLLRSFLVKANDDDIDLLFQNVKHYEDFSLYPLIEELVKSSYDISLEMLTKKIFSLFDVYNKLILVGDISNNIELCNYFLQIAKEMDEMNYSIDDYALYYDEMEEYDIEPEYNGGAPSVDSVKLMTIHSSKGLQFKYVYYASLYKNFRPEGTGLFLFDNHYGVDLSDADYPNVEGIFHRFIARKAKRASIQEQLRVFYVALTRAEEKAILLNRLDYRKDPAASFETANNYLDFYHLSGAAYEAYEGVVTDEKPNVKPHKENGYQLTIEEGYKFSDKKHEIARASKERSEDANSEALLLGSKYHYYLELVDFTTLDTSFIADEKDRRRIDKFLANLLFKDASKAKIAHEYSFYDETNDIHGVIDLLLVYDDHIDIVDYKLSHVDDEAYVKQVTVYKDYISQIADGRDIHLYILGILSGEVKKVC